MRRRGEGVNQKKNLTRRKKQRELTEECTVILAGGRAVGRAGGQAGGRGGRVDGQVGGGGSGQGLGLLVIHPEKKGGERG